LPNKKYGQYCSIALALEVLGDRWTLLVLRELLCGSRRFNDLRRGVPKMSATLLTTRLRTLEDAGVIERVEIDGRPNYRPSLAGLELLPILEGLGVWGRRWVRHLDDDDLDISLLMWEMRRRVDIEAIPRAEMVLFLHFQDAPQGKRSFWIRVRKGEAELCMQAPGGDIDLALRCDVRTFTEVWTGDLTIVQARKTGALRMEGAPDLLKTFGDWIGLNPFSVVELPQALHAEGKAAVKAS
jgi:DNA-binding HxlR family transcriptional regulator